MMTDEELATIRGLAKTALYAGANSWADRRLVAALDPAAVLRLLDRLDAAEASSFDDAAKASSFDLGW